MGTSFTVAPAPSTVIMPLVHDDVRAVDPSTADMLAKPSHAA